MLFTEVYRDAIRNDPDFGPTVLPIISSTLTVSLYTDVPLFSFNKKTAWDITFGSIEVTGVFSNDVRYVVGATTATFPFKDPNTGLQTGFISMNWRKDHFILRISCNSDLLDIRSIYGGYSSTFSDIAPISIIVGKMTNNANIYYKGRNTDHYDPVSTLNVDTGSVTGIADFLAPTIAIGTPAPNFATLNPAFNVVGTAADNVTVGAIYWRWALPTDSATNLASHFTDWQQVDNQTGSATRAGWSTAVDMSYNGPGTNIFWVASQDSEGRFSRIVGRNFFYSVPSPITLFTTGNGVIRGGPGVRDQANLIIKRHYYAYALAVGATNIFRNWTDGNGIVVSADSRYDFLMQDSLLLQANFGPNPFPGVAGIYNGLFFPTNGINELDSGMISLNLNSRGTYTGTITLESGIYPFSGQFLFHTSGSAAVDSNFLIKVRNAPPILGTLHLPGNGTSSLLPSLTGQVSIYDSHLGRRVFAPITAGYSPGNAGPVRPGTYNFQIPTAYLTPQNGPYGYGCGSIIVRSNGTALTIINVADQNPQVTCNGAVTQDGRLPVCASLYAKRGLYIGWFNFVDQPTSDVQGENMHWIKRRAKNVFYLEGFERNYDGSVPNVTGSYYTAPKAGTNVLGWTTGTATFLDFLLSGSDPFTFDPVHNRFTFPSPNPDHFRIIFSPTTGIITGSFSASPTKVLRAVVLPKANTILGYFLDETQSGFMTLNNP
jgi:hypothetical protein